MTDSSKRAVSVNANCGSFLAGHLVLGAGIGLLVAEKLTRRNRQTAAIVTISAGVLACVPLVIDGFAKRLNAPHSSRGVRRRLRSIREGSGFPDEAEFYQ